MAERTPAPHELEPEPIRGHCSECGRYSITLTVSLLDHFERLCRGCCPDVMEDDDE